jgi:hypothetical protein
MAARERVQHTIVHFVGSIPLPDAETVFCTLSEAAGPYLVRLPDGETGIRKTWIRFLQAVLAENPAIEVADDVPPFKFTQWDGKVVREIPRLRVKSGAQPDPATLETGYAEMAIASWGIFERLQKAGIIPAKVKFQVSLPTPIAPTYNNMVPSDRPVLLPVLTQHFIGEVEKIAAAIPHDRTAMQWDVCQEVLAWEGYYEKGPVDFRSETIEILTKIGEAVPATIELGYHLCYGSPADEHLVQPKDMGIMVEMASAVSSGVKRPIQYFHMPVPKNRTDNGYFAPLEKLRLHPETQLYLGTHPLQRCARRYGSAGRGAAPCARRRRRNRMRNGAWRSGACGPASCRAGARGRNRKRGNEGMSSAGGFSSTPARRPNYSLGEVRHNNRGGAPHRGCRQSRHCVPNSFGRPR